MQKELIQDLNVSQNDGVKNNIVTGRTQEELASRLCSSMAFDKLLHIAEPRSPHP